MVIRYSCYNSYKIQEKFSIPVFYRIWGCFANNENYLVACKIIRCGYVTYMLTGNFDGKKYEYLNSSYFNAIYEERLKFSLQQLI